MGARSEARPGDPRAPDRLLRLRGRASRAEAGPRPSRSRRSRAGACAPRGCAASATPRGPSTSTIRVASMMPRVLGAAPAPLRHRLRQQQGQAPGHPADELDGKSREYVHPKHLLADTDDRTGIWRTWSRRPRCSTWAAATACTRSRRPGAAPLACRHRPRAPSRSPGGRRAARADGNRQRSARRADVEQGLPFAVRLVRHGDLSRPARARLEA